MWAGEALKESKDGRIYLKENAAVLSPQGNLEWIYQGYAYPAAKVVFSSVLSDEWEPCKPVDKCDACKEADISVTACTRYINHLKKYHCTCKK